MTITGSPVDVHSEDWEVHPGVCGRLPHCWIGEYFGKIMNIMMMKNIIKYAAVYLTAGLKNILVGL